MRLTFFLDDIFEESMFHKDITIHSFIINKIYNCNFIIVIFQLVPKVISNLTYVEF